MTGAVMSVPIRGKGGITIKDKWAEGPESYLGAGCLFGNHASPAAAWFGALARLC
jgi:hypothetical protein